jgi:hypothetical protein
MSLPSVPDAIPSYAQDLAIENEDINNIGWFIDRRPTTITSVDFIYTPRRIQMFNSATTPRRIQMFNSATIPRQITVNEIINNFSTDVLIQRMIDHIDNIEQALLRANANQDIFNITLSISETKEDDNCKECAICYEETMVENKVTLNCGHKFCGICIKKLLINNNCPSCSLCRTKMSEFVVNNQETYDLLKEFCK